MSRGIQELATDPALRRVVVENALQNRGSRSLHLAQKLESSVAAIAARAAIQR